MKKLFPLLMTLNFMVISSLSVAQIRRQETNNEIEKQVEEMEEEVRFNESQNRKINQHIDSQIKSDDVKDSTGEELEKDSIYEE